MDKDNIYISVSKTAEAEITEKKSRFICNITHAESEDEAMDFINKIKKQHYNAKHNVFAYILNSGAKKYTDDGEPSKTAGLPILEMLEKRGVTDVVCVVTRYFGGILLGTGGLVRAYTEAAQAGLDKAGTVTMKKCDIIELCLPYANLRETEYILNNLGVIIDGKSYAENILMTACVKCTDTDGVIKKLSESFGLSVSVTRKEKAYREI